MRKSQVQTQILNRVKRDVIHQPLQLLTGVNVIGMTSSTLGTMSRGAANLSKDDDFVRNRAYQVSLLIHVNFLTLDVIHLSLHSFSKLHNDLSSIIFLFNSLFTCSYKRVLCGGCRKTQEK